jgi:hypothetical protein
VQLFGNKYDLEYSCKFVYMGAKHGLIHKVKTVGNKAPREIFEL